MKNLRECLDEICSQVVLIVGVLVLLAMRPVRRAVLREFCAAWYLWVPVLAAFTIYGLVWVEDRYLPQFFVLSWAAILLLVRLPEGSDSRRLIRAVATVVLTLVSMQVAVKFVQDVVRGHREAARQMQIAEGLATQDVRAGEKVALVDAQLGTEWQKLARVSVVAEIPYGEDNKFWAADQAQRSQIYQALANAGANVLIASQVPEWASTTGWQEIGDTRAYLMYLGR